MSPGNARTPRVRIVSTGGTIASTSNTEESGKTPSESGEDLLESVPRLAEYAAIDVNDVCRVSGFQVDFATLHATADAVERAVSDGADGVVVTHGTDTMEETAYVLDLVLEPDVPVVCTGAQRPFDEVGTDGPANLVAAVRTAADDRFRDGGGVYIAFNDAVHAARWVTKAHTSKLETFESPGAGPVAEFSPNGLRVFREPGSYSSAIPGARIDARVELVTNAAGVDGRQVERAIDDDVDGLVVAGTGLGNATAELGAAIEAAIDDGVPVVLTSRCPAGTTAGLYGGDGGAKTLLEAGAISGGDLRPWKARLKLALALSASDDSSVRRAFGDDDSAV